MCKKYIVIIPHQLPARVLVEYSPLPEKYNSRTAIGSKFINDLHYFRVFDSIKKLREFQMNWKGHQMSEVCDRIERVIRFGNQNAPNGVWR